MRKKLTVLLLRASGPRKCAGCARLGAGDEMIVVLAGRRIDAPSSENAKFPLREVPRVSAEIRALFLEHQVSAMVSSAACGADLLALSEAGRLGLIRRIVLPFGREQFRRQSVTDRPGDWGPLYDRVMDEVSSQENLIIVGDFGANDPYKAVSSRLVAEALALGLQEKQSVGGVVVWDRIVRSAPDYTAELRAEVRRRRLPLFEVRTLSRGADANR